MVDLVKIRRKAKKKEEAAAVAPQTVAETPAAVLDEPRPPQPQPQAQPAIPKLDKFMQEAGKRRATESARVEELAPQQQLEVLTFVIAGEHYAVDIERIESIITPRPVTRIPNAGTGIVGIVSLRGTIVTLVDVRRKLRHPAAGAPTPDTRIVVIDFRNETIGFVVDRVLRVVKAAATDIEPHPVVHATELDDSIRGVFRSGGALTILLDLDKLLGPSGLLHGPDL